MADPLSLATGVLSIVGFVLQVASGAMAMVDKTVTAHNTQRRAIRNLRFELDETIQGTASMQTVLRAMLGDPKDKTVKRMCKKYVSFKVAFFWTPVELNTNSPDCVIALRQLTTVLETTREFIRQWFTNEEAAPINSHDALPNNRKSLAFIQAVFKHSLSPSTINDAIDAVEELQFEVTRYRKGTESAFRHLWYLYIIQGFRRVQGRGSVESFASVSSIRTLESITTRIIECSAHYNEGNGEPVDESNDPVRWLKEQAVRADLEPPPASVHVLSDHGGEDVAPDSDSSVSIMLSKRLILLKL